MKIITVIFGLILILFLVSGTDAKQRKRRSNNALREQLMDYLLEAQRRDFLYDQAREEDRDFVRRAGLFFEDDDNGKSYVRRKAVGLSDNPFK